MVTENGDHEPDNSYCGPANLFCSFVKEYLISTNSFGKSEIQSGNIWGELYVLRVLKGMIGKSSRCHMIPEPASISFFVVIFPLCCSPDNVGWKIHVRNVRCLLDMDVEALYVVQIWLRGKHLG